MSSAACIECLHFQAPVVLCVLLPVAVGTSQTRYSCIPCRPSPTTAVGLQNIARPGPCFSRVFRRFACFCLMATPPPGTCEHGVLVSTNPPSISLCASLETIRSVGYARKGTATRTGCVYGQHLGVRTESTGGYRTRPSLTALPHVPGTAQDDNYQTSTRRTVRML